MKKKSVNLGHWVGSCILDASLSFWLNDKWVSAALSDHLQWAHDTTTEDTGTFPTSPFAVFTLPWCLLLLTSSDCNWPADGSEDPDSDSNEAVSCSQAAVHSDHSWQHRVRQGPPDLFEHTQHQAAHLHCCWQLDTWKDTGSHHSGPHHTHFFILMIFLTDFQQNRQSGDTKKDWWPVFILSWQIVTDPLSMERLLGQTGDLSRPQLVEFCVVCGDKASGNRITLSMWTSTWNCFTLACFYIWWDCMSIVCFYFCLQAAITEQLVVRGVKASSSVV